MEVKQVKLSKTKQTSKNLTGAHREQNVMKNWLLGVGTGGGETHLWFVEVPDTLLLALSDISNH